MAPRRKKLISASEIGENELSAVGFDPSVYLAGLLDNTQGALKASSSLLLNERADAPRASNFMEFCFHSSYLNFKPFPRQLQIASHFLGEICYFCSDNDFMYQMYDQEIGEICDRIVFTRWGRCPKCQRTRFDFIKHAKWFFPETLIAIIGQRSGKNYLLSMLAAYQLHRYLTLERNETRVIPSHYFPGLGPGYLTMTFTAATLGQAMKNVWQVFQPMFASSPWFQEYGKYLNEHGKKIGEELYVNNSTYIRYRNKMIDISCAAPDKRTLRGATRILYGVDEVSWHDAEQEGSGKQKSTVLGTAEEITTSLNNSLKTVRNAAFKLMSAGDYDCPNAYDISISSPCHANDIGMRTLRKSADNPRIFGAHYATWEFNPEYRSREDFKSDYLRSEADAERDFGAMPPRTLNPWIADPKPVLSIVRPKAEKNIISYEMRSEKSMFGEITAWYELKELYDAQTPRIIAIDNGYNNNAFAVSLIRLDSKGLPRIDQCLMLKPKQDKYSVNLSKMWDHFIYPLVTKTNAALILYDRWQSLQNIQKLQDEGKDARQYSLTPKDFGLFRNKLLGGEVSYPFSEYDPNIFLESSGSDRDLVEISESKPGFALLLQTLTVRVVGERVMKPLYGDDDVFRTAMLGLKFCYDEDVVKKLSVAGMGGRAPTDARSLGRVVGMSGSGARVGAMSANSAGSQNTKPMALGAVKPRGR